MAKASLYNTFGSKDELVRAYLQTRQASVAQRITQAVDRYDTPRERLLAVFEGQGELFAQPDYRGCAFARASAESHPGDLAEQAAEAYRRWVRALLTELAAQAGVRVRARQPADLAAALTRRGAAVECCPDGAMIVTGLDSAAIGGAASAHAGRRPRRPGRIRRHRPRGGRHAGGAPRCLTRLRPPRSNERL